MASEQIVGWFGSVIILATYLSLTFGWMSGKGKLYQVQTFVVSCLYGYMNWRLGAYPAIPINVIFGFLSIAFLVRLFRLRGSAKISQGTGRRGKSKDDVEEVLGSES